MENSTRDLPSDPWPKVNPQEWMTAPPAGRNPARLWLALCMGGLLALAAGWVLGWVSAPLAALPGELGLYFFLVLGLLVGGAMYRIGLPAAPAPRPALYALGLAAALILWTASLVGEYRSFPVGAISTVRGSINRVLPPDRRAHVESRVRQAIQSHLKTQSPPGGIIGYTRWAARNGTMDLPRVIDQTTVPYRLPRRRWRWVIRAILSLVFTAGAILSQILDLAPAAPSKDEPAEAPATQT